MPTGRSAHVRWLRAFALVSVLAAVAPGVAHGQATSLGGVGFFAASGLPGFDPGPGDVTIRSSRCVDRGGPTDFFNAGALSLGVTGPVAGPYPGTFVAQVDAAWPSAVSGVGPSTLVESFSINSPNGTVRGAKSGSNVSGICRPGGGFFEYRATATWLAVIRTPEGTFVDRGGSNVTVSTFDLAPAGSVSSFDEGLGSDGSPVPFTKKDCDRGSEVVVAIFGGSKKACKDFVKDK
jgi:hypothetical protein